MVGGLSLSVFLEVNVNVHNPSKMPAALANTILLKVPRVTVASPAFEMRT
jgi:hypothetical protein